MLTVTSLYLKLPSLYMAANGCERSVFFFILGQRIKEYVHGIFRSKKFYGYKCGFYSREATAHCHQKKMLNKGVIALKVSQTGWSFWKKIRCQSTVFWCQWERPQLWPVYSYVVKYTRPSAVIFSIIFNTVFYLLLKRRPMVLNWIHPDSNKGNIRRTDQRLWRI